MDIGTILNTAIGIVFAALILVFFLNVFGDMIFEQLAELRDSWNRHFGKDRKQDNDDITGP